MTVPKGMTGRDYWTDHCRIIVRSSGDGMNVVYGADDTCLARVAISKFPIRWPRPAKDAVLSATVRRLLVRNGYVREGSCRLRSG